MLGKQFCIFIDDFNMPKRETYGAQPPIELMRQMVDMGGWYDRKIFRMKQVVDVTLIGAMGPPGGGRQIMSNRMVRHMHMLTFVDLSNEEITVIFSTIAGTFLRTIFGDELTGLAKPIVEATLNLYTAALGSLKPTPEKPHYTFNLRDISKTIQGVCMADKRRGREKEDICRLWTHEACRVFADRLINDTDRKWFMGEIKEQCKECFKLQYPKLVSQEDGKLMYCDFLVSAEPTIYEEVTDVDKLSKIMNDGLAEYNEMNIPMK
jgi:dynein heavy chain